MQSSASLHKDNPVPTPDQVGIHNRYYISLSVIMVIALGIRLVAAFFSKGFAYHDDHFDIISIAQDWVYGIPVWLNEELPPRHSMFYAGLHYGLFYVLEQLGVTNPDTKMLLVRLLHGVYSLLIVYYGYKLTEALTNKREARIVGLMLALVWFMPFMSVRNLVEMVCIPPYLAGFYVLVKQSGKIKLGHYFWAGALFALAFVFRYHTILFAGGVGLVLLYQKQWRNLLGFGLGFLILATLIQGTIDLIFFDYPFHSVVTYFLYNAENAQNFSTGPSYRFLLTLLGFMVPPLSVFLLVGYVRTGRLAPMLFLGGLLFFVVHSLFPNKQERFILPLYPLFMILGVIGWQSFVRQSSFWQTKRKLLAACWSFFWLLNIITAFALALTYSKKSRIAPLVYLSEKPDLNGILLEFGDHSLKMPPLFYLGRMSAQSEDFTADSKNKWGKYKNGTPLPPDFVMVYSLNDEKPLHQLQTEILPAYTPSYVIVVGQDDLKKRLQRVQQLYPRLKLEKTITPSRYDQVLHQLNPRVHKDERIQIYQILP
ncbi:glycosyltransferase family 39 protein [Adhaeribacter rhizoryzae]|uniref:Mannosyltransferase n=1 Tax=Adhaeribacter rhizoryzae TaxID=2607907 RepID=A0A5M6DGV3_9BACT|nr:glycosyltransferase family 39 protein [Adhaeribacter rhizoryzae]KAA5545626.1 mannosyltransferase [Adhaeribacter rhizoryzae]